MLKNPSLSDHETKQFIEIFKKVKRFRLFEPSVGVLGFIFVTFCLGCSFFYLDYRPVVIIGKGYSRRVSDEQERLAWSQFNNGSGNGSQSSQRVDFLTTEGDGCDVFDGEWVWDESYPLYQSKDCSFLDDGFRCNENGRPDFFYTKWRWQPKRCNLPRFEAKLMLEKLRHKRLVFAGDSIGRNQWESLLCMLSSAVPNKDLIYEVNGSPITKHKGYLVFKFKEYNCTVEYYRAPFLVLQTRPPAGVPQKVKLTIRLDEMDWGWTKWRDADVLVLNTGHWWNNEKTRRWGTYFQEGEDVKLKMEVEDAYRRSMETVVQKIQNEVNMNKTQVLFRTFAPVHFRGGDWKTGGHCHLETLPDFGPFLSSIPSETWPQFKVAVDILLSCPSHARKFDILNVTGMTAQRKDGHSSLYYLRPEPAPLNRQDCSHWCLPGVPDSWNELLYAIFLKRETTRTLYRAQV